MDRARARVSELRAQGVEARIYGDQALGGTGGIGGLNAFFILTAPPEVYNLPAEPELPQRRVFPAFLTSALAALALGLTALLSFKQGGKARHA
jgi:formate dehydrogenase iron-sulfur subunit